jgi:hypothetical protein
VNKKSLQLILAIFLLAGCSGPAIIAPETALVTEEPVATSAEVTEQAGSMATATLTEVGVSAELTPELTQTLEVEPEADFQFTDVLEFEMRGSFDYFWEQANNDVNSSGYGLIRDRYPGSEGIASVAAVGFGLTAYLIGIEKEYVTYEEVYARVNRTLDTLLAMPVEEGFYYHFVDINTGNRAWNSEVSSIDTALLLMGVITVGEYFGGEIQTKALQIYDRVNWSWFIDESRDMFYMAYSPENGFAGHWDFYAEQLILYILAAGSNTYPIDASTYYTFTRHYASYGDGNPFIHSWFGSIFTYQFSHAWIDFRDYTDREGVNWFNNSVDASLAQFRFATDVDDEYLTIGPEAWGLSACDGPGGYNGLYGAPPSGFDNQSHYIDDTVPPYGAIGSIIFVPEQAQQAMMYYYTFERLKGQYGFMDAFNLSEEWFASSVIGIDKGISLLMLANYEDDIVYRTTMESDIILNGLAVLQISTGE